MFFHIAMCRTGRNIRKEMGMINCLI